MPGVVQQGASVIGNKIPKIRNFLIEFINDGLDDDLKAFFVDATASDFVFGGELLVSQNNEPVIVRDLKQLLNLLYVAEKNFTKISKQSLPKSIFDLAFKKDGNLVRHLTKKDTKSLMITGEQLSELFQQLKKMRSVFGGTLEKTKKVATAPEIKDIRVLAKDADHALTSIHHIVESEGLGKMPHIALAIAELLDTVTHLKQLQSDLKKHMPDLEKLNHVPHTLNEILIRLDTLEEDIGLKKGFLTQKPEKIAAEISSVIYRLHLAEKFSPEFDPRSNHREFKRVERMEAIDVELNQLIARKREIEGQLAAHQGESLKRRFKRKVKSVVSSNKERKELKKELSTVEQKILQRLWSKKHADERHYEPLFSEEKVELLKEKKAISATEYIFKIIDFIDDFINAVKNALIFLVSKVIDSFTTILLTTFKLDEVLALRSDHESVDKLIHAAFIT